MTPLAGHISSGRLNAQGRSEFIRKEDPGADELAPVTQLFTEDYMVEFLLHNTLGAWWAGESWARSTLRRKKRPGRKRTQLPPRDGDSGDFVDLPPIRAG